MLVSLLVARAAEPPSELRFDALAWSADSRSVYAGIGYDGVYRLDPATGRGGRVFALPESSVDTLWADAAGFVLRAGTNVLTFGSDGATGVTIPLPEDDGFPTGVAVSPDGKTLAVGACAARRDAVTLFDRATGRRTTSFDALRDDDDACANDIAFVGSSVVAAGNDGRVVVWKAGAQIADHRGPGVSAEAVAASPDGRWLAVAGWADAGNVLDVKTGRAAWSFGFVGDTVGALDWSADGRWLAAAWAGDGAVWDTATHRPVGTLPGATHTEVAFSPDSKTVAWLADGRLRVAPVASLPTTPPKPEDRYGEIESVASPPGQGRWTSVAGGVGFACGVRGGSLVCWGVPRVLGVDTFPVQDGVARVVAAERTVCTIGVDRALRCFGANDEGQANPSGEHPAPPGGPPLLRDVVDAAVGDLHACAVGSDGRVWCWGLPDEGRLGGAQRGAVPGVVSRVTKVVDVEIGGDTTCVRTQSGEVWCWGPNEAGVLGLPTDDVDHAAWPVRVEAISGARWLAIGAGVGCAGTSAGTRCWGTSAPPRTEDRVWLGGDDACGSRDGGLACTGWIVRSEGIGDVRVPVDAAEVAFGEGFACAVDRAGDRWCWGDGLEGELGRPAPRYRAAAAPVQGLTDAVDLAVADGHACAVRRGGEVTCWGSGHNGQLGTVDSADADRPTAVPDVSGATHIASSDRGSCVVAAQGLRCWGGVEAPAATGPSALAIGRRGVCALTAEGASCRLVPWQDGLPNGEVRVPGARFASPSSAFCVADGAGVRCGGRDDDTGQGVTADQLPMGPVVDLGRVDSLVGGDVITCAIEEGRPRCWGDGALTPLRWADDVRAVDVAVRDRVACLVTPEGRAACLGDSDPASGMAAWTEVPGVTDAKRVGVGRNFACALRGSGDVVCWGDPDSGVLGDGAGSWTRVPQRAP